MNPIKLTKPETGLVNNQPLPESKKPSSGNIFTHAWQCLKLIGAKPVPVNHDGLRPPGHVTSVNGKPVLGFNNLSTAENKDLSNNNSSDTASVQSKERLYAKSYTSSKELPRLNYSEAKDALRYFDAGSPVYKKSEHYGNELTFMKLLDNIKPEHTGTFKITSFNEALKKNSFQTVEEQFDNNDLTKTKYIITPSGARATINYFIDEESKTKEIAVHFTGWGYANEETRTRSLLGIIKNWFGFKPAMFDEAQQLLKLVKDNLGSDFTDDKENKTKFTVTGESLGGALASYAGLQNEVPAVVFNPLRLGLGARASIGQTKLHNASKFLTEVVVSSDCVSDPRLFTSIRRFNPLSWFGIVHNSGVLGGARRFIVPHIEGKLGMDAHNPNTPLNAEIHFHKINK